MLFVDITSEKSEILLFLCIVQSLADSRKIESHPRKPLSDCMPFLFIQGNAFRHSCLILADEKTSLKCRKISCFTFSYFIAKM